MATTVWQEHDSLVAMSEDFVDRLDFVDAVVLFALVKRAPDDLARVLAATIWAASEADGLAEECSGRG